MKHSRRKFLQLGGTAFGALVISPYTCSKPNAGNLENFGLQLYSVRDVFEKDPVSTLKQVASFGYTQVESYERNQDMFWGLTNKGFKRYMDEMGMSLISSHCDIEKDFERKAGEAAEIGMKYLVFNWPYSQQTIEVYKKKADLFNACGAICKKAGIRFAYHNYESSFQLVDGIYPHDLLMERTDAGLVDHQMDIYWVVSAGADPATWLKKYPNRFRLSHIKDRQKGTTKRDATCDLGKGSIDFKKILGVAKENGMQYYIAEQEHYPGSTPMKSAESNAAYMRRLRI